MTLPWSPRPSGRDRWPGYHGTRDRDPGAAGEALYSAAMDHVAGYAAKWPVGDVARRDGEGLVYICDRTPDTISRTHLAGYKVPREVSFHDGFPRDPASTLVERLPGAARP